MRTHRRILGALTLVVTITITLIGSTATPASADFASDGLAAHNGKRSLHLNTPNLVHGATLRTLAQTAATSLATSDVLSHDVVRRVLDAAGVRAGVNLYQRTGTATAQDAVNAWYNEIQRYNWNAGDLQNFNNRTGHFTQVVWASSARLGMARAVSSSGYTYVVALYAPPGNVLGQFRYNVRPLK